MKKRLLSALLTLCMGFSLLPVPAAAVDEEPTDPAPTEGAWEKAYFYIHDGSDATKPQNYVFAGTGQVDASHYSQEGSAVGGDYSDDYVTLPTPGGNETHVSGDNAVTVNTFPDIPHEGKKYVYQDSVAGAQSAHTYTVKWDVVKSVDAGYNIYTGEKNYTFSPNTPCWHVDGKVAYHNNTRVDFKRVLFEGSKDTNGEVETTPFDTAYVSDDDDLSFQFPEVEEYPVEGSDTIPTLYYRFEGWYSEEGCAEGSEIDEASPSILSGDENDPITIYAKYVAEPIYFFISLPSNSSKLSGNAKDYRYLTYGGAVESSVDPDTVGNAEGIRDEEDILSYVAHWPTEQKTLGHQKGQTFQPSSSSVENGTWIIDKTGTVTSFRFTADGKEYTNAAHAIRWAKMSYTTTKDGNYRRYHIDGVLYEKKTVSEVLETPFYKSVEGSLPAGTDTETFLFVLEKLTGEDGDVESDFDEIKLTAQVTSESHEKVKLSLASDEDEDQVLDPGWYRIREELTENQKKLWDTPNTIQFELATNGTVNVSDSDTITTITNRLKTFTLTYDANGGTGAPTGSQEYDAGATAIVSSTVPTWDGYKFMGWATEATAETAEYQASNSIMMDRNITLYAVWQAVPVETYTLTYDANGGSFGADETLTIPNLPADTYILTETEGYTAPTYGKYVLIGWSVNQSEDVIGAGEKIPDCTPDVTLNDANPSQTVYAVWGEDDNGDDIADAQQIVIRPADITIYTGGDGYEGVVEDDSGEIVGSQTNQGLPEPGYYLVLPYELNEDLRGDSSTTGAVDLSQHLRFSYGTDRIWVLELYNPNSYSMAYDYYIYQMVPQVAGQDPVRLEIKKDDGTYVTSDDFTITLDTLYQEYKMKLYTGEVVSSGITVEINTGTGWTTVSPNEAKGICAIEGDLTVRGTNSNDPTTSIESSVTSPVDVITAEAGDVTYYINDSDIRVVNQDDVALLSDELVGAGVDTLLAEAEDRLGLAWYEDYEYQTQYLDLVDTSNGNAYVTLGEGDSVDIHWPMPNGTSRWNTEFYVVHFDGLDRNFDDLDARLDSGNVDLQVYTLGDGLRIENGNLVFTTDTFSPFVLIWQDSDRDWPDDDDDDDNDRPSHDDDDDNDRPEQEDPAPELDKESHIAYVSGTPEGTIEPNAYITREEVATIFFRLLTDRSRANYITDYNPFPDVDSSRWSFYPIVTMNNAGIMHGYDDGNFAPSGYITRAEFAVVAAQFSDAEYTGADLFSDISGHWAREYINRAASEGWISGYPDGSFGPDDYITRAQVMALVNEVLDRAPDADYMLDDMITWPDNADESAWYYEDVQEATNSHSYVWRNSGRTSEEWEDLIDTRTLDELVRDAFNGVGISY